MAISKRIPPAQHVFLMVCIRLRNWLGLLLIAAVISTTLLAISKDAPIEHRRNHGYALPNDIPAERVSVPNPHLQRDNSREEMSVRNTSLLDHVPGFLAEFGLESVPNRVIVTKQELGSRECEGDCELLKEYLDKWPASKPTGAIYYLTQKSRLNYLQKSLQSLDENFNNEFQYPVIIFHERELFAFRRKIKEFTKSTVFFQEITLSQPHFLTQNIKFRIPCLSTISYRKMCRFHAKEIYEYPIIQDFDYLFRLDDDSLITNPVHYDVFKFMQEKRLLYGYIWMHYDALSCTEGLWEATENYVNISGVTPHFFHEWKRPRLYYNNFEISKTQLWLSPEYRAYVNYLDQLGGMFYHRWGDAPIKGLAVSMFINQNQTHLFSDIPYKHNTFTN